MMGLFGGEIISTISVYV